MTPPGYKFEQRPLIRLALEALISILVSTSTVRLKSKGDRDLLTLNLYWLRKILLWYYSA
jgi:hypothetical protein